MTRRFPLWRDRKGVSAVEFALLAPALIAFIIGISQLGILFFANAGLKSAMGEAARLATLFPRPSDSRLSARFTEARFGLNPAYLSTPTIAHGRLSGRDYIDIRVTYDVPIDFLFFRVPPVRLTESRRVFVHPA